MKPLVYIPNFGQAPGGADGYGKKKYESESNKQQPKGFVYEGNDLLFSKYSQEFAASIGRIL